MKRIIYSSLFIVFLLLSKLSFGQALNFSVSTASVCSTGNISTNTVLAAITSSGAGSPTSFSFTIINPVGCVGNSTIIPVVPNGSVVSIIFPCCGNYFIQGFAYIGAIPINAGAPPAQTVEIVCPTSGTVTPQTQTICIGNPASLTGSGAIGYQWFSKAVGGPTVNAGLANPLVTTPLVNTTYTMIGTTAAGCTVVSTASVYIQNATLAASPATITACTGATIALTSTPTAITNGSFTAGTATTGIVWIAPTSPTTQVGNTRNVIVSATNGIFTVSLTHTGQAGVCTLTTSVLVNTTNVMPVTITLSSPTVCPGSSVTLTGSSGTLFPTSAANYSWTAVPALTPANITGNPITRTPSVNTTYSVNASYFGCTGSATAAVIMGSITPTFSTSVPNSCPGRSLTLTAGGAVNYTFTANSGFTFILPKASPTVNTVSHSPSNAQLLFPINYCVIGAVGACTGTTCSTVGLLVLTPSLTSITGPSVCPGTAINLSATCNTGTVYTGAGISYTFIGTPASTPSTNIAGSVSSNTRMYIPVNNNPLNYPINFCVSADSAGCKGSTCINVNIKTLTPTLSLVNNPSNSICAGTNFTLNSSMCAGPTTTITFIAPPGGTNFTTSPCQAITSNTIPGSTYTVSVDSAGCVGEGYVTITTRTINTTFTLSPLGSTLSPNSISICAGSTVFVNASGGTSTNYTFTAPYLTPSGSNTISNGPTDQSSITITPNHTLFPFPHTYTVSADSGGCSGGGTFTVNLFSISPTNLSLTASSPSVCPGTQFTLNATPINPLSAYNYTFSTPSPSITNSTNTLVVISPTIFPSTYTVLADSISNFGQAHCYVTKTVSINLKTLSGFALTSNSVSVCSGKQATLTATGQSSSTTLYSYTFAAISPTNFPIITNPGTNSIIVSPTILTTYAVLVDSAGCKSPTLPPITVNVGILPNLNFLPVASSNSVCGGLSSTITILSSPTNTYTWFMPLGSGSITPGPAPSTVAVVNPSTNAIYTVQAIDALGCVGINTVEVVIDPSAKITVTLSSTNLIICPTQAVTLTAVADINPSTFSWTPGSGLNSTIGSSVIAAPLITTAYSATANNGYGCVGSAGYTVTVAPTASALIVPSSSAICAGFNATLTGAGATTYTWTGSTFTGSILQPSISVTQGTYSLTGSNGGSCIDSSGVITITISPNLILTTGQSSFSTCIQSNYPKAAFPVTFSVSGASTYAWFPFNSLTYSLGPQTSASPLASTCYTVTGNTSVCSGTAAICLTVAPQFTIEVTPPLPAMCLGDTLKMSIVNISNLAFGPVSQFKYKWNDPIPISVYNPLQSTVVANPAVTSNYSVEVRDARDCISMPRLVTVTVFPRPITAVSIPTINSVATNTVCFIGRDTPAPPDNVITLTAGNNNTGLPFGIQPTYTWTSPYKPSSILTPANNNIITVSAPSKAPTIAVYTVQSGYNGIPGCARFDTVGIRVIDCRSLVNVKSELMFEKAQKDDTICSRQCITFVNKVDTAAGGPLSYTWTFQGGSPEKSNEANPTVCYNLPGKYNVILNVTSPYPKYQTPSGSTKTGGLLNFVKIVDIPNVTIKAPGQLASDTIIRFGQFVELKASNALRYEWSPAYNISSLTNKNVKVNPFRSTQYVVTGYNSRECFSTDTLNIFVVEDCGEMYVPNAFSPNNDGHNDILYVRGLCLQTMTFMVFNRWGEKIFETTDQKIGWNGAFKGVDMNTGVYVYRLEGKTYEGKGFSSKGNITLIR
jgi:gliding motility-associated-like protein